MEKLPTDIEDNILCRLSIETILQAKQVCKTWSILLRSKTDKVGLLFAGSSFLDGDEKNKYIIHYGDQYDHNRGRMNYNYDYHAFDKIGPLKSILQYSDTMLGSCTGLVCFQRPASHTRKSFIICNPIAGEVVYAPNFDPCIFPFRRANGFGYCQSTNEYKIVRMYSRGGEARNEYHVQVHTVGTDGWRNLESISFSSFRSAGVYVNGALHWLHWDFYQKLEDYKIVAFDLEDEKFQFIPLSRGRNHVPNLVRGNNLYFEYTFCDNHYCMDKHYCTKIWAYKRRTTNTNNGCDMKVNYNDNNSLH